MRVVVNYSKLLNTKFVHKMDWETTFFGSVDVR